MPGRQNSAIRRRLIVYLSAVAAVSIAATVVGEIFLVERVVEHSRRADMRFATGVSHAVWSFLAEEDRHLVTLLAQLPWSEGENALRKQLPVHRESMIESGCITLFADNIWALGAERCPGGQPSPQVLFPTIRAARQTGQLAVTSLWVGTDGRPRISLVSTLKTGQDWHAAVGNIRLDETAFLSHFSFFLSDEDVRLQILDAAGIALFSTVPAERYRSVIHGTYLLDRVRQGESSQVKCHSCHQDARGRVTHDEEVATVSPVSGTSWSVLVRENPSKMQQVLLEMVVTIVALVCLILGTFLGFYLLLARRVLRPLRQLANAAEAVNAATPANQLPGLPRDEMQAWAHSFETMLRQAHPEGGAPDPTSQQAITSPPGPAGQAENFPSPPSELRESLQRALTAAVDGYRNLEIVSAILVIVEGEALGQSPLVVGTQDVGSPEIVAALRRGDPERNTVTREELMAEGVPSSSLKEIAVLYRGGFRPLAHLRGDVWVGTSDLELRAIKPIAVLIKLHVQGILDRSLLSDTLWHEYRQKSRMLGHLFEAEAEERKRIAREIHDDTAQTLTSLALLLEAFPIGGDSEKQAAAIRTAKDRVRGIIDSTDRIMKRLRPALLDDLGLVEAVYVLGEDVLSGAGIDFELDAPEEEIRAAPELEDAIFRVFQEAASNVVRHAQATRVLAGIDVVDGQICARFEDDGRGMGQPSAESFSDRPRFGLLGMRERVSQFGGSFHLSSSKCGGLRIDVAVPYRTREGNPP